MRLYCILLKTADRAGEEKWLLDGVKIGVVFLACVEAKRPKLLN